MGRSTSCFKIITCARDSIDQDDLQPSESKGSSDKRGWSFRKRSARHRVLSNTVILEAPSSGNKESPESAAIHFQTPADSTVPEKISVPQRIDEKPQFSTPVNANVTEAVVVTEKESRIDANVEEIAVISIQAAIRGIMSQMALLKLKNVVKLQAAVRGHLVRRHAVGSLRCIQAIIKMQALVRARRARLSSETVEGKLDGKHGIDNQSLKSLEKEVSLNKPTVKESSIEKLLSNKFAHQLLESTPKTKPIQMKCDTSKPSSAWSWLERWMSVSPPELAESEKPGSSTEKKEGEKVGNSPFPVETEILSEVDESADPKSSSREMAVPIDGEGKYDTDNFDFQRYHSTCSSFGNNLEPACPENTDMFDAEETLVKTNSLANQTIQSDVNVQTEVKPFSGKPDLESEQLKPSMKRIASEQLESEGKKTAFGSRKAINPAFIAVQSKFEELSSTVNSGKSISSPRHDVGVDSNIDTVFSGVDSVIRTKELNLAENSPLQNSRVVQVGGSECGTELSITSTLDSPDISEAGAIEFQHETKLSEDIVAGNLNVEAKDVSNSVQEEKPDDVKGGSANSILVEQKPERSASDLQMEMDLEMGRQAYRSSPEASPRSHITVPESQGTPSSQVSVKAKRSKTDKSGSRQKRRSLSAGKRSPSNPNHDSGARSSVEQLPKDQKVGKRRNSMGSVRPDNVEQEQRDSSSSIALPSYMQATESARAKANLNISPRSSPDVLDKDVFVKKRHSLPGANDRQVSPRIQRSMSQAQQGAKANGTQPPERKWQR